MDQAVPFASDLINNLGKSEKKLNEAEIKINHLQEKINVLEGSLAVQKAVTDTLSNDRHRLEVNIIFLEDELDDLQQYSRRTCLLIHGVEESQNEGQNEDIEAVVMNIINTNLDLELSLVDIGRTHRVGRMRKTGKNKIRPLIVRFLSYRQRKKVFDWKKKLKGQKVVITESLTKKRYALLQRCIAVYGLKNVWSYDGPIYCKQGDQKRVFTTHEELDYCLAADVLQVEEETPETPEEVVVAVNSAGDGNAET